jgi:hypothetical protein
VNLLLPAFSELTIFSTVLSLSLLLVGCTGEKDANTRPDSDDSAEPGDSADPGASCETLPDSAKDVLETHCYRCHGQNGATEGGFNSVLDVVRMLENGKIDADNPASSSILMRMQDGSMPPSTEATRPDADEIAVVEAWLTECDAADFNPPIIRDFIAPEIVHAWMAADIDAVEGSDPLAVPYLRYVSLVHLYNAHLSDDQLITSRAGLSRLLNALSFNPDITPPTPIGEHDLLYRIDLRDYNWGATQEDPVDRWEILVRDYPFGFVYDDATYEEVRERTGSRQPILHADWLVSVASVPPIYHDILQTPDTLDDFLLGFNVNAQDNIDSQIVARAGFNDSGIANFNRG